MLDKDPGTYRFGGRGLLPRRCSEVSCWSVTTCLHVCLCLCVACHLLLELLTSQNGVVLSRPRSALGVTVIVAHTSHFPFFWGLWSVVTKPWHKWTEYMGEGLICPRI